LRGRLGFDGFVCADYGSVAMLHDPHSTATSYADAGVLALGASLDMELPERHYFSGLEEGLQDGTLDLHVVDESVRRVLVAKLGLGLFENPYANLDGFAGVDEHSHRELRRQGGIGCCVGWSAVVQSRSLWEQQRQNEVAVRHTLSRRHDRRACDRIRGWHASPCLVTDVGCGLRRT
jgi:hypothetical protein